MRRVSDGYLEGLRVFVNKLDKKDVNYGEEYLDWKKKTVLFLSGQTISLFGSSLVQFAIIWYTTLSTKSGIMIAVSAVCSFLPQIVISPFSGVWADRYNRRLLIIFGDMLVAASTLILALLFLLGYGELWTIFLVSGIRSIGTGIQSPAVNAFLPQIVPTEMLIKVNGINGSIQSLIMLLSPAASGALLTLTSLGATFSVDVVTALIAIFIMMTLRVAPHKKASEQKNTGYFIDFAEGLRYIGQHDFIKGFMMFYGIFMFLIVPAAFLTPLMIARTFGEEVWRLTANEVLFSAGSILGGIIIATWGGFKNRIHTIAFACTAIGILTASLGFSTTFVVYLIIIFITGITLPFFNSASVVLLQEKVEQDMQGRVFSFFQIVSSTAMPVGMILFGSVADIIKIELLLIITGAPLIVLGVGVFNNKRLKYQ